MTRSSSWLHRTEITLWVIGLSLFGVALGAAYRRHSFQAAEERILESRMVANRQSLTTTTPPAEPVQQSPRERTPSTRAPDVSGEIAASLPADNIREKPAESSAAPIAPRSPVRTVIPNDDPDLLGKIEIRRIGLSAMVRKGADDATLDRAVGWVPGTRAPGDGGNTGLAGHRDSFFRPLRRVRVDDRIRLVVPPHTYEYRVDSTQVVKPDAIDVLQSTGTEELTLVTCYPFNLVGSAPERFIVKASRVE